MNQSPLESKSRLPLSTPQPLVTENWSHLRFHPLFNVVSARVFQICHEDTSKHLLTMRIKLVDKKLTQNECKLTWYQKGERKSVVINLFTWQPKTNRLPSEITLIAPWLGDQTMLNLCFISYDPFQSQNKKRSRILITEQGNGTQRSYILPLFWGPQFT